MFGWQNVLRSRKMSSLLVLSEHGVQLLRDVVFFVSDVRFPQLDHDVWVRLAVDVRRMKICRLRSRNELIQLLKNFDLISGTIRRLTRTT